MIIVLLSWYFVYIIPLMNKIPFGVTMDKYERMAAKLLKQSHDKSASKPADIILQQMGGA